MSSSLPTIASALQLEGSTALLGSWLYCVFILHLGCTVSSSFISAVLCVHPSSQLYCVFILHLSCTVSSSLPTLASALQLEGSTALLGSWLYCVFISTTYCWCSLIGMILPTGLFGILLVHIVGLRQVLLHDFIVYLLVHMVHGAGLRLLSTDLLCFYWCMVLA